MKVILCTETIEIIEISIFKIMICINQKLLKSILKYIIENEIKP